MLTMIETNRQKFQGSAGNLLCLTLMKNTWSCHADTRAKAQTGSVRSNSCLMKAAHSVLRMITRLMACYSSTIPSGLRDHVFRSSDMLFIWRTRHAAGITASTLSCLLHITCAWNPALTVLIANFISHMLHCCRASLQLAYSTSMSCCQHFKLTPDLFADGNTVFRLVSSGRWGIPYPSIWAELTVWVTENADDVKQGCFHVQFRGNGHMSLTFAINCRTPDCMSHLLPSIQPWWLIHPIIAYLCALMYYYNAFFVQQKVFCTVCNDRVQQGVMCCSLHLKPTSDSWL